MNLYKSNIARIQLISLASCKNKKILSITHQINSYIEEREK